MRIPDNTIRNSHMTAYGAAGLELMPGVKQPGCPRLYRMKYVEHKISEEIKRVELDYGLTIHDALFRMEDGSITPEDALIAAWHPGLGPERFDEALKDLRHTIEKGGILPMLSTVAVEIDLSAPLYDDEEFGEIRIGGRLDGVWVNANDLTTVYVGDYKTDRSPPSKDKVKSWVQGRVYALLVWRNLHLWFTDPSQVKRVVVLYDAVKWSTIPIEYTPQELEAFASWAEAIARKILRDKKGQPILNPNCTWCPVRATCPAWQKLPKLGETLIEKLSGVELKDQVVMLEQAIETRGKLNRMIEDVKEALEEQVTAFGPYRSEALGKEWYLDQGTQKHVDLRRLHRLMKDQFYDVVTVGIGKFKEWKEENLHLAAKAESCFEDVPKEGLSLKERKIDASSV